MVQTRRARKKEMTRQSVLSAAKKLFVERGFAQTTVDDIAELANVAKVTFYYYFKSKEEIVPAINDGFLESLADFTEMNLSQSTAAQTAIRALGAEMARQAEENRKLFEVFFERRFIPSVTGTKNGLTATAGDASSDLSGVDASSDLSGVDAASDNSDVDASSRNSGVDDIVPGHLNDYCHNSVDVRDNGNGDICEELSSTARAEDGQYPLHNPTARMSMVLQTIVGQGQEKGQLRSDLSSDYISEFLLTNLTLEQYGWIQTDRDESLSTRMARRIDLMFGGLLPANS